MGKQSKHWEEYNWNSRDAYSSWYVGFLNAYYSDKGMLDKPITMEAVNIMLKSLGVPKTDSKKFPKAIVKRLFNDFTLGKWLVKNGFIHRKTNPNTPSENTMLPISPSKPHKPIEGGSLRKYDLTRDIEMDNDKYSQWLIDNQYQENKKYENHLIEMDDAKLSQIIRTIIKETIENQPNIYNEIADKLEYLGRLGQMMKKVDNGRRDSVSLWNHEVFRTVQSELQKTIDLVDEFHEMNAPKI